MRRALHQLLQKRGPADWLAEAERIERGYPGTLLRLTLLALDIVEAHLEGRQPGAVGLPRLLEPFPVEWAAQHHVIGSGRTSGS
jgi:hypothetical protein